MPSTLEEEVLYVSDELYAAAHLCACGCGSKIRAPLGPEKWSVKETRTGPTVRPSVGKLAKSLPVSLLHHRWRGGVVSRLVGGPGAGRADEQSRLESYYSSRRKALPVPMRLWRWFRSHLWGS
jgi:hypothetical protein